MKEHRLINSWTLGALLVAAGSLSSLASAQDQTEPKRPDTPKCDQKDDYFGTTVADPYRWMEVEKTPEIQKWIEEENALTQSVLEKIPFREELRKEMTDCYDYAREGAPSKHGDRYFYSKNSGLQNQSTLYYRTSLDGEETLLLDPNTLSDDGTVALSDCEISKDGRYAAFATSTSGSDWRDIFIVDIEKNERLDDAIQWAKFTNISWYGDGFFYSR